VTRLQQVLWELQMDYIGHPYYVSGNAILHALGPQLAPDTHRALAASHGVFVPGQFGTLPDEHSRSGVRPSLGANLPDVRAYDDLFLHRTPRHPWLLDSRARDALNTHDIRVQSGHPALAHELMMGRSEDQQATKQTMTWYVHAVLSSDDPSCLPLGRDALDGLQFGGKRNYGYGEVGLKETQVVDLDALDYSRLEGVEAYRLELITPFVLETTYPGADDMSVPWWWAESRPELRERAERLVEQRDSYELQTVDHGQVVTYCGDNPVETAKNGIRRVGSHSRCGFGEFRVVPAIDHGASTA
jgi:hypothetical protein